MHLVPFDIFIVVRCVVIVIIVVVVLVCSWRLVVGNHYG